MGYDIHITRAEEWLKSKDNPITLEEWKTYIDQDPEMRLDGYAEAWVDGHILRVENEGLAVWLAWSGHGIDGNMAWMYCDGSEIIAKNPDADILKKMYLIALYFEARVQGDEDEYYDENGDVIPEVVYESDDTTPARKTWWRKLFGA